jgi:hypothetical protein
MTADVETVVSETIEKVNEWLRNAVTKHGKTVYRPFVLEEPHLLFKLPVLPRIRDSLKASSALSICTAWDYILLECACEGEEADEHGLAGDWFLTNCRLTVAPIWPHSAGRSIPDDEQPHADGCVRERVAELSRAR